jgi:hypothetical protein
MHAVAADARAAQLDLEGNVVRTYATGLQYGLLDNTEAMLKEEQKISTWPSVASRAASAQLESPRPAPLPETGARSKPCKKASP